MEMSLTRFQRLGREQELRYRKEQELMLSALHEMGVRSTRDHLANQHQSTAMPSSWLARQRRTVRDHFSHHCRR
jgi:protein HOOK3